MASPSDDTSKQPRREMKVLSLGLPRTGSASMAEALTILGYQNVHHCSKALDRPSDWRVLNAAADATFPCLPTYTGVPFTRTDWDEIYGTCEAATDAASMFGPELIAAYPEAKVILVERDYERWFHSVFDSLVPQVWGTAANFSLRFLEPITGNLSARATRKVLLGLFSARTPDEARANARQTYLEHGRRIRELMPPERLLEYRMGDGWGPLCRFLGKDVPDEDFPWLNEAAALRRTAREVTMRNLVAAAKVLMPWAIAAAVTATSMILWRRVYHGSV